VHSATLDSGVLDDEALLRALADLRRTGVAVGLTVSGPRQGDVVRRALDVEVDGANPFTSVQATWNLLEPSAGPALAEAHGRGWGVIVKEALANGRLSASAPEGEAGAARRVAGRLGVPVETVAVAAALHQPWAHVVLSGAVRPEQLATGLAALDMALPSEERERLAGMAEPPDEYWRRRAELPWH
jgi:aryl-alcohol dehydrogenase-like predicted oxidoreductase